jgi:hypothetical protein
MTETFKAMRHEYSSLNRFSRQEKIKMMWTDGCLGIHSGSV